MLDELEAEESLVSGRFTGQSGELQWADPDLIGRIQSRTLAILRHEIRPASPLRYASIVRRRQAVGDPRDRGEPGRARGVLQRLRGMFLPLRSWNDVVFPARLGPGHADAVESAFRSGDFVWVAVPGEGGPPMVTVFPRASGHWYLPKGGVAAEAAEANADLTPAGAQVWEFLRSEGTAGSSDIRDALHDLSLTEVRNALAEVTGRGLVTADSWRVMSALHGVSSEARVRPGEPSGTGRRGRFRGGAPGRDVARAVREAAAALPPDVRWSAVSRFAILGPDASDADRARAQAAALADRYGVVTKYVLVNEASPWSWGPVATELSLMEMRGAIRRGYFVSGLPGLQFATNDVVDALRAGPAGDGAADTIVVVNAADPAFALDRPLFESIPDVPEVLSGLSRVPSTWVAFAGDFPVLLAEDDGRRISADDSPRWREAVRSAIAGLRAAISPRGGRVTVETWNGAPALASAGAEALAAAGFRRDYPGMTFDEVQARLEGLRQSRAT